VSTETTSVTITDENPLYLDPEDYDEWLEDSIEFAEDYDEWIADRPVEQEYIDEYTEDFNDWLEDAPDVIVVSEYADEDLSSATEEELAENVMINSETYQAEGWDTQSIAHGTTSNDLQFATELDYEELEASYENQAATEVVVGD
jgi:hypothetical protein